MFRSLLAVCLFSGWSSIALAQAAPNPPPAPLFTPETKIAVDRLPGVIRKTFARLAHDDAETIPFTESRMFAISKAPVRQSGVLRSSKTLGLSLAYEGARPHVVVIDDRGLIERQPGGRERQIDVADHPELAQFTDLYLNLMRGNAARLFDYADVYFSGSPRHWQLGLLPHDASIAKRTGRVVISGDGRHILRIENQLPGGDARTMEFGRVERNPHFTPEQAQAFFRH